MTQSVKAWKIMENALLILRLIFQSVLRQFELRLLDMINETTCWTSTACRNSTGLLLYDRNTSNSHIRSLVSRMIDCFYIRMNSELEAINFNAYFKNHTHIIYSFVSLSSTNYVRAEILYCHLPVRQKIHAVTKNEANNTTSLLFLHTITPNISRLNIVFSNSVIK